MFYTVFDIETTGFDGNICEVIQFAYALLDENFNCLKAESLYFYREGMHWSKDAENVHHISQSFLSKYADEFETNIKKMYIVLSRCNAVTFNGEHFDIPFCNAWLRKFGFPDIIPNRSYDVMKIYQPVFKKRVKLVSLPERIGLSTDIIAAVSKSWFGYSGESHDASYDVTATALGFSYAIKQGYVYDDSRDTISIEEQSSASSAIWQKDFLSEEDFSSMVCYMIEDKTNKYIVNLCSDKSMFAFLKVPMQSYKDVIYSNKYKEKDLPIQLVNNMIAAVESGIVFKGENGKYSAEIAPGICANVEITGQQCKFYM